MPYSGAEDATLPNNVKKRAKYDRQRWVSIFNNVQRKTRNEIRARDTANAAISLGIQTTKLIALPGLDTSFLKCDTQDATKGICYTKDVLKVGKYKHPLTGQKFAVDRDRLDQIAASTNRYLKNGNPVPFPEMHGATARGNLGWWEAYFKRIDDHLVGIVEVPLAADQVKIGTTIKYVSVHLASLWEDAQGEQYEDVLLHVAAASQPVIPGQRDFFKLELAVDRAGKDKREISVLEFSEIGEEKKPMSKAIAVKLGLEEGADEAAILKAIDTLNMGTGTNEAKSTDLGLSVEIDKLKAQNEKLEATLKSRAKRETEEFVAAIQARATKAGVPLSKEQVAKVEKYFEAGMDEQAREIGNAYADTSEAKGNKAPGGAIKLSHDGVEKDAAAVKASIKSENESYAKMMRAQGYQVKLSADGQEVAECKAPEGYKHAARV